MKTVYIEPPRKVEINRIEYTPLTPAMVLDSGISRATASNRRAVYTSVKRSGGFRNALLDISQRYLAFWTDSRRQEAWQVYTCKWCWSFKKG
ncbi:hypothetical protein OIU76_012850 [Salix suchowensis]|nr:hypothetical protein OIU76_012850 [Salix suchowensis]